jgi:hypothetical protein
MFITLLKEYFLPALLVALIFLIVAIVLILVFSKSKKSKYTRKNAGAVIWSPDLGVFIHHYIDNRFMFSKNGEHWQDLILPKIPKNEGDHICYSNTLERFVIILGGSVYTSLDGMTWTEEVIPVSESKKEMIEAKEVYNLINQLRNSEEGNSVTIYHDNFDSALDENCHNNRIDFIKGFDDYQTRSFFGNSLKECLQIALKYEEEKEN